jgi:lipopolysaccharide transport system ATP-binding protein
MPDFVITAEGLGKSYLIGHQAKRERYTALRDVLSNQVRGMWDATRRGLRRRTSVNGQQLEEFWALRDVSFEVKRGEVVGVIGRNGAGKSTLLKILSRITEPAEGRITLRGRVASLLEVGTGFHPELTGRENIFLNGAILGMTRAEIKRKFDEIVAFAEVENFLDTPVKRYSSGMYVRLAFAVAAHLEPEILLVDEILAVGDADFQQKSLGKMSEVAQCGRTIIFVSHNMTAIQSLCSRALLFSHGRIAVDQSASIAVREYLSQHACTTAFDRPMVESAHLSIVQARLLSHGCDDANNIRLQLCICSRQDRQISLDIRLCDALGNPVGFGSLGTFAPDQLISVNEGLNELILAIPSTHLANGSYLISFDVTIPFQEYLDRVEHCLRFDLDRPPMGSRIHMPLQKWGYGSYEIPITLESKTTPVGDRHALTV